MEHVSWLFVPHESYVSKGRRKLRDVLKDVHLLSLAVFLVVKKPTIKNPDWEKEQISYSVLQVEYCIILNRLKVSKHKNFNA